MDTALKKMGKRQNVDVKVPLVNGKKLSGKEVMKQLRDDNNEATEPRSKEQRVELSFSNTHICEVCLFLSFCFASSNFC